jgi:acetyl-CoA carboxylase biotin carboxyl carrier protein
MNGIFFDSSRPGEDSFVKKGKEIKKDTTVCIIEAMKLMNEVRVEKPCRIKEVMVKNAESVQIKQPLFKITEM